MQPQEQNKSSIGSIIGTIIIITIIILGGLYFWGKRIEESRYKQKIIQEGQMEYTNNTSVKVDEVTSIKNTGSSDDISSIEADLNNTKTDNLSSELDQPLQ